MCFDIFYFLQCKHAQSAASVQGLPWWRPRPPPVLRRPPATMGDVADAPEALAERFPAPSPRARSERCPDAAVAWGGPASGGRPSASPYLAQLNKKLRCDADYLDSLGGTDDAKVGARSGSSACGAASSNHAYIQQLNKQWAGGPASGPASGEAQPADEVKARETLTLPDRIIFDCPSPCHPTDPNSGNPCHQTGDAQRDTASCNAPRGAASGAPLQCGVPPPSAAQQAMPLPRLMGLTLHGSLGSGSYGCVFQCTWQGTNLAVKIYREGARGARDAERELKLLLHVDTGPRCPVISHLEAWRRTSNGRYFLFFAQLSCDMHVLLRRSRDHMVPIDARQAMHFTADLSQAVAFLHARRVIHRDMKPSNILLRSLRALPSKGGGQPAAAISLLGCWQAVLGDLGCSAILQQGRRGSAARWAGSGNALTRGVCTLWYAAPEMLVQGEAYGHPVDLWSLGLILLEVEAGEPACPTKRNVANWDQLQEFWYLCQPAAAKGSVAWRAREELRRHGVFSTGAAQGRKARRQAGQVYGPRFRHLAFLCLDFDPQGRVPALQLSDACQRCIGDHVSLPRSWVIGC